MAKIYSAGDGHCLYRKTQFGEDRCTQFRVIVVTDQPTHKQTGPIRIHCAAASAQCKEITLISADDYAQHIIDVFILTRVFIRVSDCMCVLDCCVP